MLQSLYPRGIAMQKITYFNTNVDLRLTSWAAFASAGYQRYLTSTESVAAMVKPLMPPTTPKYTA